MAFSLLREPSQAEGSLRKCEQNFKRSGMWLIAEKNTSFYTLAKTGMVGSLSTQVFFIIDNRNHSLGSGE